MARVELNAWLRDLVARAGAFGYERFDDGMELFGHVPHVAPAAFLHELFPGVSRAQVEDAEEQIGRAVPEPYATWLTLMNGCHLFSGALALDGLRVEDRIQPFSLADAQFERPPNAPAEAFFFGSYIPDGSKVYLDECDGRVVRCPRDSARPLNEWSGFEAMLRTEVERLQVSSTTVAAPAIRIARPPPRRTRAWPTGRTRRNRRQSRCPVGSIRAAIGSRRCVPRPPSARYRSGR